MFNSELASRLQNSGWVFPGPELPPDRLRDYVEQLVVDAELLTDHLAWLRGQTVPADTGGSFTAADLDRLATDGLAATAADTLARLAYNGTALTEIRGLVCERVPLAWDPALDRLAERAESQGYRVTLSPDRLRLLRQSSKGRRYGWC